MYMKRTNISLVIFLVIICLMPILIFVIGNSKEKSFKKDFEAKRYLREELIEKIVSNEIKIDENNNAILTEKYYGIALYDDVSVFVCNEKEKVIEFYYDAGFPDEAQSIFYSSEGVESIKKYIDEHLYAYIEKIEDNWYLVQYNKSKPLMFAN